MFSSVSQFKKDLHKMFTWIDKGCFDIATTITHQHKNPNNDPS